MPNTKTKNGVNKEHYKLLEQKIEGIYNQRENNFLSTQTPFEIVPRIEIVDEKNAGDIQTVKVVKVAVYLTITEAELQTLFNQFKTTVIVTDKVLEKAITKAIKQIKTSDPKFKIFFTKAEANVLAYYEKNCAKILKSASTHIERKDYNKAYGLLKYIPENMSCFTDVEHLITKIYTDNKDDNCKKILEQARNQKAYKDYSSTLYSLVFIDSESSCYPEALKMAQEVKTLMDKEDAEAFMPPHEERKANFAKLSHLEKIRMLAAQARILNLNFIQE
ncbi:hypothetical protein [Winogradskyella psychrotolerans]|nr:hypothetical protein [Winogradskyella psychrotolerans]